jgi:hypothetical protein
MSGSMPADEDPRAIPDPGATDRSLTHTSGAASSADSLIASLLTDQRRRWQQGEQVRVETYLVQHPALQAKAEAILDLIYNEMLLQEQAEGLASPDALCEALPAIRCPDPPPIRGPSRTRSQQLVHNRPSSSQPSSPSP